MSVATNTELKEMSHRNLNTFTSFNEWMALKEQKECSKKCPSGNNFWKEKKHHKFHWVAVPEQLYSDMHSAITIQYPSPSSTFLQSSTINKMSSASSSNLLKPCCCISYSNHHIHPQAGTAPFCNHFNYTSLLCTHQLVKQIS